jgi:hypothetical protein
MAFLYTTVVLTVVSVGLILMIRKDLRQREIARKLRTTFIAQADDLVAKPDFPDKHARMLTEMAAIPQGWITRYFVIILVKNLFWSSPKDTIDAPSLDQVPEQYLKKYVIALLALALSDSYRSVIFGRIFRTTNSWIVAAIEEPKSDVRAHATRIVIEQVAQYGGRKWLSHRELALA